MRCYTAYCSNGSKLGGNYPFESLKERVQIMDSLRKNLMRDPQVQREAKNFGLQLVVAGGVTDRE